MPQRPTQAPVPTPNRQYFFKSELVALSGLSPATIHRYMKAGKLPFIQPGGKGARVLFPLDALETARQLQTPSPLDITAQPNNVTMAPIPGPKPRWLRPQT